MKPWMKHKLRTYVNLHSCDHSQFIRIISHEFMEQICHKHDRTLHEELYIATIDTGAKNSSASVASSSTIVLNSRDQ